MDDGRLDANAAGGITPGVATPGGEEPAAHAAGRRGSLRTLGAAALALLALPRLTGSQKATVLPETWFAGGRCPAGQNSNIRVTALCVAG